MDFSLVTPVSLVALESTVSNQRTARLDGFMLFVWFVLFLLTSETKKTGETKYTRKTR